MKKITFISAVLLFGLISGSHSLTKKVGVVMDVRPGGAAVLHTSAGKSNLKPYTEIFAGDIIEITRPGKVEIFLNNLKNHTIADRMKIKILDDYSIVDADTDNAVFYSSKRSRFSEDLARDTGRSISGGMGASRGGDAGASRGGSSELTERVKKEIKEAEKIEDEYLRHTAMYYIYWKHSYSKYMKKEGEHLARLEAEGKGGE